jgi:predicted membrane channel-forming protein YqfA (hemolysin III family)
MIHNESVNIWTHLVGALFIIFLVIYTANYIDSHRNILTKLDFNKFKSELKNLATPITDIFPRFNNFT